MKNSSFSIFNPAWVLVITAAALSCFAQMPYTRQADSALVKRAAAEALVPVREANPESTSFQYRNFCCYSTYQYRSIGICRFIYPPSFDFLPVPGATAYKFLVYTKSAVSDTLTFTEEKPYASLTPIWKDMPAKEKPLGQMWTVRVYGVSPDGKETGPSYHATDQMSSGTRYSEPTVTTLNFFKGASFEGPYFDPPEAQDLISAANAYAMHILNNFNPGGYYADHAGNQPPGGFSSCYTTFEGSEYTSLLCKLLRHGDHLSASRRDSIVRAISAVGDSMIRDCLPVPSHYAEQLSSGYRDGLALIDLYEATGLEKWKAGAEKCAAGFAGIQDANGNWRAWRPHKICHKMLAGVIDSFPFGPDNEWMDPLYLGGIDPSEILEMFGALRVRCKTDRFLQNETNASDWLMRNSARSWHWSQQAHHSWPAKWGSVSPKNAFHFCEYLLEYAPPEKRDIRLVESIVRFCEDQYVFWKRDGDPGRICPYERHPNSFQVINRRDSEVMADAASRIALLWLKLYRITGDRLYQAKAEALVGSLLLNRGGNDQFEYPTTSTIPAPASAVAAYNLYRYAELLEAVQSPRMVFPVVSRPPSAFPAVFVTRLGQGPFFDGGRLFDALGRGTAFPIAPSGAGKGRNGAAGFSVMTKEKGAVP